MADIQHQLKVWGYVLSGVSAISAMVCFGLSVTYRISFGKLGLLAGLFAYILFCVLYIGFWMVGAKAIPKIPDEHLVYVSALVFVVTNSLSVLYERFLGEKADGLSVASYALFAMTSVLLSRQIRPEIDLGFTLFFITLFLEQFSQISLKYLPIAALISLFICIYRCYPLPSRGNGGRRRRSDTLSTHTSGESSGGGRQSDTLSTHTSGESSGGGRQLDTLPTRHTPGESSRKGGFVSLYFPHDQNEEKEKEL